MDSCCAAVQVEIHIYGLELTLLSVCAVFVQLSGSRSTQLYWVISSCSPHSGQSHLSNLKSAITFDKFGHTYTSIFRQHSLLLPLFFLISKPVHDCVRSSGITKFKKVLYLDMSNSMNMKFFN